MKYLMSIMSVLVSSLITSICFATDDTAINSKGQLGVVSEFKANQAFTDFTSMELNFETNYGLSENWELALGTYLNPSGTETFQGAKIRAKTVSGAEEGFNWGMNVELAAVKGEGVYDVFCELRPIVSYNVKRWLVAVNPVVNLQKNVTNYAPEAKVLRTLSEKISTGVEYGASLNQSLYQNLLAVVEYQSGQEELKVGLGRQFAENEGWLVKAEFGHYF